MLLSNSDDRALLALIIMNYSASYIKIIIFLLQKPLREYKAFRASS
jgi:hypothetical protein